MKLRYQYLDILSRKLLTINSTGQAFLVILPSQCIGTFYTRVCGNVQYMLVKVNKHILYLKSLNTENATACIVFFIFSK